MPKVNRSLRANSSLNGEWCSHAKKWLKKRTSGLRRLYDKKIIREELKYIGEDL